MDALTVPFSSPDTPSLDEWGRPIVKADGSDDHSAWSCNNRQCHVHPPCLYGKTCTQADRARSLNPSLHANSCNDYAATHLA